MTIYRQFIGQLPQEPQEPQERQERQERQEIIEIIQNPIIHFTVFFFSLSLEG